MSAFCVFGVTYDACVKQAKKKVAPYIKEEGARHEAEAKYHGEFSFNRRVA